MVCDGKHALAPGVEPRKRRLPPEGWLRGGSLFSLSLYENPLFLTKSRGCGAAGWVLGGCWCWCGDMGVSRPGCGFVCAPVLQKHPSFRAGVGAGLGGEDARGLVPTGMPVVWYPLSFALVNGTPGAQSSWYFLAGRWGRGLWGSPLPHREDGCCLFKPGKLPFCPTGSTTGNWVCRGLHHKQSHWESPARAAEIAAGLLG